MATARLGAVLWHLRQAAASEMTKDQNDAQLLDRIRGGPDEAAFTALVKRHGRMVWGVCRHVLSHEQDAEDAFQATFLVLARKAGSIRKGEAVGSWLHGVAYRITMKAKRDAAVRRAHEQRAKENAPATARSEADLREALALVDEEVQRLPERYRAAFVLCHLEGKGVAETARQLGTTEGALAVTLTRARKRLRERLARRGVTLSAALSAVALSRHTAEAAVPGVLTQAAIQAVTLTTAGRALATAGVSAKATVLAEGVMKAMLLTKLKVATAVVLVVAVIGAGVGGPSYQTQAAGEATAVAGNGEKANEAKEERPKQDAAKAQEKIVRDFDKLVRKQAAVAEAKQKIEEILKAVEKAGDKQAAAETLEEIEKLVTEMKEQRKGMADPTKKYDQAFEEYRRTLHASREEAIRVNKARIDLATKELRESKDDKSLREALEQLERAVQMMKVMVPPRPEPAKQRE